MTTIWAAEALTDAGWQAGVRVDVAAEGRIESVDINIDRPSAMADGQGRSTSAVCVPLLLPALSNVHSHAFQRAMAGMSETRGPEAYDSFWTWRQTMYRFVERLSPDDVEAVANLVFMEMLEAGYASVGEFHYLHHQPDGRAYGNLAELADRIVAAAEHSGIGLTLLPVLYEQGGCDGRALSGGQRRFGNSPDRFASLYEASRSRVSRSAADATIGVAPHSLRAVSPTSLSAVLELASDHAVHVHVAEQRAEVDEVLHHLGARPVQWLLDHHDVDQRWCLIHCTQMTDSETRALAASGAVAGLCPITESSLGDGIFGGARYREANGRWAVGSDSNVRIALAEELRTLEYSQRLRDRSRVVMASADCPGASNGRALYDAALQGGAQALTRNCGVIAPGAWADLVALDTRRSEVLFGSGDAVFDAWLFAGDDSLVSDVWSAGRHVVCEGRHVHRDSITGRYRRCVQRLLHA